MRLDQALQTLGQHVGVDLRRCDIGMAEQRLQGAQIGAARQHVAGEGMPQHVRRDPVHGNPGTARDLVQDQVEALAGERPCRIAAREQPGRGRSWRSSGIGLAWGVTGEFGRGQAGGVGQRHHPLASTLAAYQQHGRVGRQRIATQRQHLRDAHSGRVQDLDRGTRSALPRYRQQRAAAGARGEQPVDLRLGQHTRQGLRQVRAVEMLAWIVLAEPLPEQMPVELAQAGQPARGGTRRQPARP